MFIHNLLPDFSFTNQTNFLKDNATIYKAMMDCVGAWYWSLTKSCLSIISVISTVTTWLIKPFKLILRLKLICNQQLHSDRFQTEGRETVNSFYYENQTWTLHIGCTYMLSCYIYYQFQMKIVIFKMACEMFDICLGIICVYDRIIPEQAVTVSCVTQSTCITW